MTASAEADHGAAADPGGEPGAPEPIQPVPHPIDHRPAAERADDAGLRAVDTGIGLIAYIKALWGRRYFINEFAQAKVQSANAEQRLGQVWLVLNPLLNAAVFFFIFGVLLNTRRGIDNYVAFLITGVFLFTFMTRTVTAGSNSIARNLGLVRAFHFPRAVLPISSTLENLLQLGYSLIVLLAIILLTGEPITVMWLLFPVALGLQTIFAGGLALVVARATSNVRDIGQLLPFVLRTWLYLSGVFYSVQTFAHSWPPWARLLIEVQPGTVYLEIARDALLDTYTSPTYAWALAVFWAVLLSLVGFIYFWRGEKTYGRG